MSVIVKGMEMPTVCIEGDWYGNCPMDRLWCAQRFAPEGYTMRQIDADQQDKLPDWCPLRPLPEKHGRLIDIDALPQGRVEWEDIDHAPTIVEAEGGMK